MNERPAAVTAQALLAVAALLALAPPQPVGACDVDGCFEEVHSLTLVEVRLVEGDAEAAPPAWPETAILEVTPGGTPVGIAIDEDWVELTEVP